MQMPACKGVSTRSESARADPAMGFESDAMKRKQMVDEPQRLHPENVTGVPPGRYRDVKKDHRATGVDAGLDLARRLDRRADAGGAGGVACCHAGAATLAITIVSARSARPRTRRLP